MALGTPLRLLRETNAGRLLAAIVTERGESIRVVTAYDLDAGQTREYPNRRAHGE